MEGKGKEQQEGQRVLKIIEDLKGDGTEEDFISNFKDTDEPWEIFERLSSLGYDFWLEKCREPVTTTSTSTTTKKNEDDQ